MLSAIDAYTQATEASVRALRNARASLTDELIDAAAATARITTLGEIAVHLTSGSRGWAAYYAESGALFIRITNLTRETTALDLSDRQHVLLPNGSTEGTRTKVEVGDVLVSITADLGIIGVVGAEVGDGYVNQHIALVRPDPARAFGPFVALVLASARHGQTQFARLNDAGAKAGLNLPAVRSLTVPLPDLATQRNVVAKIATLDARIEAERAVLRGARTTKSAVAQHLLTGAAR